MTRLLFGGLVSRGDAVFAWRPVATPSARGYKFNETAASDAVTHAYITSHPENVHMVMDTETGDTWLELDAQNMPRSHVVDSGEIDAEDVEKGNYPAFAYTFATIITDTQGVQRVRLPQCPCGAHRPDYPYSDLGRIFTTMLKVGSLDISATALQRTWEKLNNTP